MPYLNLTFPSDGPEASLRSRFGDFNRTDQSDPADMIDVTSTVFPPMQIEVRVGN